MSASRNSTRILLTLLAFSSLLATNSLIAEHPLSGGKTTIIIPKAQLADRGAFSRPATNLSLIRRGDFFAGNSFFQNAWVSAPASTKARDGLGPVFNTMSCQSCHIKDGRGRPPRGDEKMTSMLLRLSRYASGEAAPAESGVIPDPIYGAQLQPNAIHGVQGEATPVIEWQEFEGQFADGTTYKLRKPKYKITAPRYGPISKDIRISGRVAPVLVGVGLLDTVSQQTLLSMTDPDDADGDGISGRQNMVWDIANQKQVPGRFGWKAEQPNIRQQVASAFSEDIGITSSLYPLDSLTETQKHGIKAENGGSPEVSDEILALVTFYCKTLAVPARRGHTSKTVMQGEKLFREAGCAKCHFETLRTGTDPDFPELSDQEIHPYTDLLLHDMGPGLADDRPVFQATGSEWRTPPLWGIGVVFRVNRHTDLLHDGRARNVSEAILWHGGEAESAKKRFVEMNAADRRKLLVFIQSL